MPPSPPGRALGLENVREVPIRDTGVISLSGKVYNGTVHVALLARVFGPFPDDVEPVGTLEGGAEHRPDDHVGHAPPSGPLPAGQRRSTPARRPDRTQDGPLIPPRPPDRPGPTQGL